MSTATRRLSPEALYELFCTIRPFPRERMDWIAWLGELYDALDWLLDHRTDATKAEQIGQAERIVELLYGLEMRGSTPWGTWLPPSHLREARASSERAHEAEQAMRTLLEQARKALEPMKVLERLGMQIVLEGHAVCGLAGSLEQQLVEIEGLTIDDLVKPKIVGALATARDLRQRLQAGQKPPDDSAFHAHLDVCTQCSDRPFDLCDVGRALLEKAAD